MPVLNVPFRLIFATNPSRDRRAQQPATAREEFKFRFAVALRSRWNLTKGNYSDESAEVFSRCGGADAGVVCSCFRPDPAADRAAQRPRSRPRRRRPATQPAPKPPVPFPQDARSPSSTSTRSPGTRRLARKRPKKLTALDQQEGRRDHREEQAAPGATDKLNTGGSVLSESARAQLEKEIDKLQRDIQFAQQNDQAEIRACRTICRLSSRSGSSRSSRKSPRRRGCTPCSASPTPAPPTSTRA